MPNDKVTSSVDYRLKLEYEMTFETGKAVYKDLIEEGMLKRIEEINPIKACKLRIDRYRILLKEEEAKLENLELLEKMAKLEPKKQNKKNAIPEFDLSVISNFEKSRNEIAYQIKTGSVDWKRIAEVLGIDSANDAKRWVIPRLQEVGSI